MQLYPAHAADSLEFTRIRELLSEKCRTDEARSRVAAMRFMNRLEIIEKALKQTAEFKLSLGGGDYFPGAYSRNLQQELRLLSIHNAILSADSLVALSQLALTVQNILLWFKGHSGLFPNLELLVEGLVFEKEIVRIVNAVLDEQGQLHDHASRELMHIRANLSSTRQTLRRTFEHILRRLGKAGFLADISESFMNGRRVVAVAAEHKRSVRGILHGESDTARTSFIEPEETIELNNALFSLEREEVREIQRILQTTTAALSPYATVLQKYYQLIGLFDFIRAKAVLAQEMEADLPMLSPHPGLSLVQARHPLLLLQAKKNGKTVVPLNLCLDRQQRILIISGPNAGGKTVSMKTAGLLQMMTQAGMLIPADPRSEMGIFKQLMIHIGDTQSIEHELSTYSAHLRDMKHFLDFANGKTLFFIDELGSGSDPALGGAFAEAIVEELAQKHAIGIITTHYLNLKVMAGKVPGIFNGAMMFDENLLEPLYQLTTGKPGSSYTFAIAQRSGLSQKIIDRARELTERGHVRLDKILHQNEKQSLRLGGKEKQLDELLAENEKRKEQYERLIDKERLRQHQETLKLQNKIKKEELEYLRNTERKFKAIVQEWKKTEDKSEVIQAAENVLFQRKQVAGNAAAAKKADKQYEIIGGAPQIGDLIRNRVNHQVGTLTEIRDKKATVRIGKLPFQVGLEDWVVVRRKNETSGGKKGSDKRKA
ncbi:MAG: DNA mismatch repair protein MutS [Bacteroidetes bacterium]|nr:DNA mismatch repair protein MutS [Bacteroidota bacterium]